MARKCNRSPECYLYTHTRTHAHTHTHTYTHTQLLRQTHAWTCLCQRCIHCLSTHTAVFFATNIHHVMNHVRRQTRFSQRKRPDYSERRSPFPGGHETASDTNRCRCKSEQLFIISEIYNYTLMNNCFVLPVSLEADSFDYVPLGWNIFKTEMTAESKTIEATIVGRSFAFFFFYVLS